MVAALVGTGLLGAFVAAEAWGERLQGGRRRLPLLGYALLLLLAGVEFARNDHGFAGVVFPIAFVAAPVLVIFGGSAAGVRRFYGWPDLCPTPGRLAAVAAALLLGVLVGTRVREADVEASMGRGREVAIALAWRRQGTGTWPARIEELFPKGGSIDVEALVANGAVRKGRPVKVLGQGEITVKVQVTANRFSGSAKTKIEAAGGSVTVLG